MSDIQCHLSYLAAWDFSSCEITYSHCWHSDLGYLQLTLLLGKYELSDVLIFHWVLVLQTVAWVYIWYTRYSSALNNVLHASGTGKLPLSWPKGNLKQTLFPSSYSFVIAVRSHLHTFRWLTASIVMLLSRQAFALSVRRMTAVIPYSVVP